MLAPRVLRAPTRFVTSRQGLEVHLGIAMESSIYNEKLIQFGRMKFIKFLTFLRTKFWFIE